MQKNKNYFLLIITLLLIIIAGEAFFYYKLNRIDKVLPLTLEEKQVILDEWLASNPPKEYTKEQLAETQKIFDTFKKNADTATSTMTLEEKIKMLKDFEARNN